MSGGYFFALIMALGLCVIGGLLAHRPKRACLRYCEYELE
jgi:hypothetical protein